MQWNNYAWDKLLNNGVITLVIIIRLRTFWAPVGLSARWFSAALSTAVENSCFLMCFKEQLEDGGLGGGVGRIRWKQIWTVHTWAKLCAQPYGAYKHFTDHRHCFRPTNYLLTKHVKNNEKQERLCCIKNIQEVYLQSRLCIVLLDSSIKEERQKKTLLLNYHNWMKAVVQYSIFTCLFLFLAWGALQHAKCVIYFTKRRWAVEAKVFGKWCCKLALLPSANKRRRLESHTCSWKIESGVCCQVFN